MPAPPNYDAICRQRAAEEEAAGKAALAVGDTQAWKNACIARDAWLKQVKGNVVVESPADDACIARDAGLKQVKGNVVVESPAEDGASS